MAFPVKRFDLGSRGVIRHTCVNCDGGKANDCGFVLLFFSIFIFYGFGYPTFVRFRSRTLPGRTALAFRTEGAREGAGKCNSRGGRRTATSSSRKYGMVSYCFYLPSISPYNFVVHLNILTQLFYDQFISLRGLILPLLLALFDSLRFSAKGLVGGVFVLQLFVWPLHDNGSGRGMYMLRIGGRSSV